MIFGQYRLKKIGTLLLATATVMVAISIMLDGTPGKAFNGMAGLSWFAAAALLCYAAWKSDRSIALWAETVALTAMVAFLVTPSDFVPALLGFAVAGFTVTMLSRERTWLWATLVVALYLPFHVGTGIGKAVVRSLAGNEASIRTDPPPTAAIIPMVMLAAALAGATIAIYIMERRGAELASRS